MSAKISVTSKALNLLQLKETMDEIVFNHIDSAQKWEKAYNELNELINSTVHFFNSHVTKEGVPRQSTYWVLFMDIASRLIYFHTVAYHHLKKEQNEEVTKDILQLYTLAANCIPDVRKLASAEFLMEVAQSYEELEYYKGKQGEFERVILEQNNRATDCINAFSKFAKIYKK
ncbi:hypothetical protein [Lysinibacillus telephonicus]|uniref:Uncharacterized protein n=1 Tax=Lysinibacillus telephonicus TaxID=1714840 RepID=A0A431UWW9_9BACI|nr:hypothetical protein [Lysinibacillus telephonicus]RTQ95858.1 hypothetical protein EKG35_02445 [Lysinibacillus telephonicus]